MIINSDVSPEKEKQNLVYILQCFYGAYLELFWYTSPGGRTIHDCMQRTFIPLLQWSTLISNDTVMFFLYILDLGKASVVLLPINWGENIHFSR